MGGAGGGGVCCPRLGWPLYRRNLATAGRPVAALQLEPVRDVADVVLQRLGRHELRHQILGRVGMAAEAPRQVTREPGRVTGLVRGLVREGGDLCATPGWCC